MTTMSRLTEEEKRLLKDPGTPKATKRALRAKARDFERPRPKSGVTTKQSRRHHFGEVKCRGCAYVEPPSFSRAKSSECKETGRAIVLDDERRCNKFWPKGRPRPKQSTL